MAKGSESKNLFFKKLQEVFPESFWAVEGKELRIPYKENGEEVQLKIAATCAKENIEHNENGVVAANPADDRLPWEESTVVDVTPQEKANVAKALAALGL